MDREERRRRTFAVAARRRTDHLARVHDGDQGNVDCICELAVWYFAKRRSLGCDCRKRKKGSPRGPGGALPWSYDPIGNTDQFGRSMGVWREGRWRSWHKVWQRDRIYEARAQWRLWAPQAAAGRLDVAEEPAPPKGY